MITRSVNVIAFALLAYAVYDQFIMPRRNGPVLLAIPLLRRSRVDGLILRRSRGMASSTGPLRLGIINWSYTA
jgi:uncharacterized membrane protein YobD (UPF0266 family)